MTESVNRNFKGVWIPKEIWTNKELTLQEKVFIIEIDSLDNEKGCYAGNHYFAKFFGLSKSRVSQVISELRNKGLISVQYLYKEGSKQIDKRIIKVNKDAIRKLKTPLENKTTPLENKTTPLESCEVNNTKYNNTKNNNTKEKEKNPSPNNNSLISTNNLTKTKTKEEVYLENLKKEIISRFKDEDIIKELKVYVDDRRKKGLTITQWQRILDNVVKYLELKNKEAVIDRIENAIAGGYRNIVFNNMLKPDKQGRSKFDNTTQETQPTPLSHRSEEEQQKFKDNLAKHRDGTDAVF